MNTKPLDALLLAALAWVSAAALRASRRRRAHRPKAKPEAIQTWEGEGGGLPDGGPGAGVKVHARKARG